MSTAQSTEVTGPLAAITAALRQVKVHDVSPVINDALPMWFMFEPPVVTPVARHDDGGVAVNTLAMCEHSGTHVDAPFHFAANGATMAEVPADALLLRRFCKYDLTANDPQPGELLGLEHLKAAEAKGGFTLEPGDVAIIEMGWDRYLPGGADAREPGWWGSNTPGLSEEACEYLADLRPTAMASDTPACDVAALNGELVSAHGHLHAFLPRGILIVEGLQGLANVPSTGLFLALPLKIEDGTGSPVRVLLITE
jgi:kynurenine formamidase